MGDGERATPDRGHVIGHAHFVGLSGPGMLGLAQGLAQRGMTVSGSAPAAGLAPGQLGGTGVRAHAPHAPLGLPSRAHLVVYDAGTPRHHGERLAATRSGVAEASQVDVLRGIFRRQAGVAVLGGRSAGLAAAMAGWTLREAGLDPTVLLETPAPQFRGWGRLGAGPHAMVEVRPGRVAEGLDSIGPRLTAELGGGELGAGREHGGLLWGGADPRATGAVPERIGLERGDDWWGADLKEDRGRFRFRAFHRGRFVLEARLRAPGRGAILGALAAVAICGRLDVPAAVIRDGVEGFAGLSRGFESRGSVRGVTLVDDRAGDPDGVAEALALCRRVYGARRLRVAFGPDAGSACCAAPLAAADSVLAVGDGEARDLAGALEALGVESAWATDRDRAVAALGDRLEPGDVLLTLGCDEVGTIADALLGFR